MLAHLKKAKNSGVMNLAEYVAVWKSTRKMHCSIQTFLEIRGSHFNFASEKNHFF